MAYHQTSILAMVGVGAASTRPALGGLRVWCSGMSIHWPHGQAAALAYVHSACYNLGTRRAWTGGLVSAASRWWPEHEERL